MFSNMVWGTWFNGLVVLNHVNNEHGLNNVVRVEKHLNHVIFITLKTNHLYTWFNMFCLLKPCLGDACKNVVRAKDIYPPLKGGIFPDLRLVKPRSIFEEVSCR